MARQICCLCLCSFSLVEIFLVMYVCLPRPPVSLAYVLARPHPITVKRYAVQQTKNNSMMYVMREKQVLLRFKDSLNGSNASEDRFRVNWHENDKDPCKWTGITCQVIDGYVRVIAIELQGFKLQGELFHGFSGLTALSKLNLANNSFTGALPPDIGNLTNLKYLDLSNNSLERGLSYLRSSKSLETLLVFSNFIEGPVNLTNLPNLRILNLASNRLNGSITGVVPRICGKLVDFNVSTNHFRGSLSDIMETCNAIRRLDISENDLSGPINPGYIDRLNEAFLCCNNFSGQISENLFPNSCTLQMLDLSENQLYGTIPNTVYKCKELVHLDFSSNKLTGQIPKEIGRMQNLQILILGNNTLSRDIPRELTNCKNMTYLDLSANKFGDTIQHVFAEMKDLQMLILHNNLYKSEIPDGIFHLSNLVALDISYNNFTGPLPSQAANLKAIEFLIFAGNNFTGSIPTEFGQLVNLQVLDLSNNFLTGIIPSSLGNLTSMLWLMLANNQLTGSIPPEMGNCRTLLYINLANNQLSGKIPEEFTSAGSNPQPVYDKNTKSLLPFPRQSGPCLVLKRWIPADYIPFSFLYDVLNRKSCKTYWDQLLRGTETKPIVTGYLQFTGNKLRGPIPKSIKKMNHTNLLLFGINKFDGEIPGEIADLPLTVLNVSRNNFRGHLPVALSKTSTLQCLDFSYNNFSGQIPNTYTNLTELAKFNISYNQYMSGMMPTGRQFSTFDESSYFGDDMICLEHLPNMRSNSTTSRSCNNNAIQREPNNSASKSSSNRNLVILFSSIAVSVSIFICALCTLWMTRKLQRNDPENLEEYPPHEYYNSTNEGIKSIHFFKPKHFTFSDLLLATSNFSESHVIGMGGYGKVYKGRLRDGTTVAVKRLQQEGPEAEKEFISEMQTLGSHDFHENLVPLLGCCMFGAEKYLVYEYMTNGSLEDWLHEKPNGVKHLDWNRRYKIALGTARGLKFLHHDCKPAVIHRDMKASNILLDRSFVPHVTDFGLARLLKVDETHVSTVVAGTLGYVPPEYSQSWRVTTKGDVYSFGVVLLELATGKRPLFENENGGGYVADNLIEWVNILASNGRALDAVDPFLLHHTTQFSAFSSSSSSAASSSSSSTSSMCSENTFDSLLQKHLKSLLYLAQRCTHESPDHRPNMEAVVNHLESLSPL